MPSLDQEKEKGEQTVEFTPIFIPRKLTAFVLRLRRGKGGALLKYYFGEGKRGKGTSAFILRRRKG